MGVQEVSGGMWLQIPGVDGIQNGLLEKSILGCFSTARSTVSRLPGRVLFSKTRMTVSRLPGKGLFSKLSLDYVFLLIYDVLAFYK